MNRVCVESPLAGNFHRNVKYARLCMYDCLRRGEAPYLSHLLYTQVLDDTNDADRVLGIMAGHAWLDVADFVAVYTDLGKSNGMNRAIEIAIGMNKPVHYRQLPPNLSLMLERDEYGFKQTPGLW